MRNCIVVSFLFIFAFTATPLEELGKLPSLYEHFREHKEDNKKLGFLQFIYLHYSAERNHSDSKHNHLPFKSIKDTNVLNSIIIPKNFNFSLKKFNPIVLSSFLFNYSSAYSFQSLNSIWQPPRM